MNRNDYRRALVMLRSLKNGVSGYVRLERRTLIGTLQFTINGAPSGGELYAVLLQRSGDSWSGIKSEAFGAPRYGQTGLVWKFDPRNISGRTLEQFNLAAVVEIRGGLCDLLLCGSLNGSIDADWTQVREAACRLFSPVRISGAPIPPIADRNEAAYPPAVQDQPQTLPDFSEDTPAYPGETPRTPAQDDRCGSDAPTNLPESSDGQVSNSSRDIMRNPEEIEDASLVESAPDSTRSVSEARVAEAPLPLHAPCELDMPASDQTHSSVSSVDAADSSSAYAPCELDMPASDQPRSSVSSVDVTDSSSAYAPCELDMPASDQPRSSVSSVDVVDGLLTCASCELDMPASDQTRSSVSSVDAADSSSAYAPCELDTPASDQTRSSNSSADAADSSSAYAPCELDMPASDQPRSSVSSVDVVDGLLTCASCELDTPAQPPSVASPYTTVARKALYERPNDSADRSSQENTAPFRTAGELLALSDPTAVWPKQIEPLRSLFFSSEAVYPFEEDNFVFIRVPLPEETGVGSCLIGVSCESGVPSRICYAIPAAGSSLEPPAGLEGYVRRSGPSQSYWTICEQIDL